MKAPIHSQKHIHQITLSTATVGTVTNSVIIDAVAPADVNSSFEILEGALVKSVYLELWVIGSTADQFFTAIIGKFPSSITTATFAQMAALNAFPNKKNILYTTQGLAPNDGVGQPVAIFRGWIKIPKGKQRFGLRDRFILQVASRGDATITFCGLAIYKEYT